MLISYDYIKLNLKVKKCFIDLFLNVKKVEKDYVLGIGISHIKKNNKNIKKRNIFN